MPFLGIDQSLQAAGLCLLNDKGFAMSLETVDTKGQRGAERLYTIRERVRSFLPGTACVAMEGYSYDSTSRHFDLGEVGGVIKLLLYEQVIPLVIVAPVALKKFATGNIRASKEDMCLAACVHDDNQADAFFLATIARHMGQNTSPNVRAQLEVLQQLRHPVAATPKRRVRRLLKNAI